MYARRFRSFDWAFAILGTAAVLSPFVLKAQDLQIGTEHERRLAGGESHSYRIEASPGARLLVTVDQRGIDVVVEVLRPDGSTLIAVDSPTDSEGPESILLPPDASGPLEVRVLSPNRGVAPGGYAIRLERLAPEQERLEAERLTTEAAARNREGTAESRRLGADRFQEAMVRWRALGNRREEARCALAAGGSFTALGQPKEALELYRQALERFEELADEAGQAAAWSGIGLSHTALGDTAAAVADQRRALSLRRGLGNLYEEGKALNNLGFAVHRQGELREAQGFYEQALEVFERAGENGWWKAAVLQNLAAIYIDLGEPESALWSHRQVLDLQRTLGDRRGEARTLNNLGVLLVNLGELGEALETYASALAIFRESGDRLREAALLHNLGVAYYILGDSEHALANLEPALSIRREGGDRRGEVATVIEIGQVHVRLGDDARARELGQRAAGVASAAADRRGEMLARLLLGQVDLAAGEPAAALSELARALDLARTLEERLVEVSILQLMGQAHLASNEPEKAGEVLTRAVDLGRVLQTPARLVGPLTHLARAERRLGRPAEARLRVEEALQVIETLRATETDPDLRASFLASQRAAFELEIDLLMELGHAQAALEVSERARARSLLDLLQEAGADIREGIDPELRERERALLVRLNAKADLLARPAAEARRRAAEGEIRAVLAELAQVDAEIRRRSPRYAALTRPAPATSGEIQALLDGDTLLLEYALGEERSFLWAVDRDSVTGYELPPRERIEAAAREVHDRLGVLAPGDDRVEQAAASLGRMVLAPVAGRLGERRLIVVADGELQYIPFGMLPIPGEPDPLLSRHEIVNAPSASIVALQRRLARREPAPGIAAVLADPVFEADDPRVTAGAGASSPVRSVSGAGPFLRLPWTRREAEAIATVVPAGRSFLALDFRASRETALSPELSRYRIVHFATHGIIDSRTPALSGLMLSRIGEHGAPREGFLGLRDVYNLRLGADLVVLSGCETALGKEVRGEGLVGLTQGFLYTGAKQVVASLWRVEDRATAELMARFYQGLLVEGRAPAAALRQAQLAIRREKRWRSPYYWSGFVLQGDWE